MNEKQAAFAASVAGYLLEQGLSEAGIRSLAKAAGTSDRMLIYYFGSKDELIRQASKLIVDGLAAQLDSILGSARRSRSRLLEELTVAGSDPAFSPVMQLWFEVVGFAGRDIKPYRQIAHELADEFIDWIANHLTSKAREDAVDTFAHLEGRMMLHVLNYRMP